MYLSGTRKRTSSRTLTTGADGLYTVNGLPPDIDYEVYAEFQGKESRRRVVSSFLNRQDNVLNFELDVAIVPGDADLEDDDDGPRFETFDLVQIRGSFELPTGIPAPIPAVLLLHGYGENRAVWADLETRLLTDGWAVMSIDLRGHGLSKTRNREPIEPQLDWRLGFPSVSAGCWAGSGLVEVPAASGLGQVRRDGG